MSDVTPSWLQNATSEKPSQVRPVTPPEESELDSPRPPHFGTLYDQPIKLMKRGLTEVLAEGRALRLEANRLIVWCRHNNVDGASVSIWSEEQKAYAVADRLKLRARAAALKESIQLEGRDVEKILNLIFDAKFRTYPYTEADELQARAELGI
jgi:hypothetical protein